MKKMVLFLFVIFCVYNKALLSMEGRNSFIQCIDQGCNAVPQPHNSCEEQELIYDVLKEIDAHQRLQIIEEAFENKRKHMDALCLTTLRELVSRAAKDPRNRLQHSEGTCCDYFSQTKREEIARKNLNPFGPLSGSNLDTLNALLKILPFDESDTANNN